jgi:hypothetical protein
MTRSDFTTVTETLLCASYKTSVIIRIYFTRYTRHVTKMVTKELTFRSDQIISDVLLLIYNGKHITSYNRNLEEST